MKIKMWEQNIELRNEQSRDKQSRNEQNRNEQNGNKLPTEEPIVIHVGISLCNNIFLRLNFSVLKAALFFTRDRIFFHIVVERSRSEPIVKMVRQTHSSPHHLSPFPLPSPFLLPPPFLSTPFCIFHLPRASPMLPEPFYLSIEN